MKVAVISLGCDKNTVDTEMMLGILADAGHELVYDESEADAVVINTCAFIMDAKQESINTIVECGRLKEEGRLKYIIITGCLGQRYTEEIKEQLPEVDAILGVQSFDKIVEVLTELAQADDAEQKAASHLTVISDPLDEAPVSGYKRLLTTPMHYAYIKLSEGCNKNCTYCIIPKLKGRYRSVPMETLIAEAKDLSERGVKELILVAQETTLYGTDLYGQKKLPELIRGFAAIEGIEHIRLLYCYPEEINDELIDLMKNEPKLCHYLDMPIQHASDAILKRMGRRATEQGLRDLITRLRKEIPDICIRTTLITGFPGETHKDHEILLRFVKDMRFDRLGVFTYSPEEGTVAASMPHQIPEFLKKRRRDAIMRLQQGIVIEIGKEMVGRVMPVVIQGSIPEDDIYVARSYRDAPDVDGYVFVRGDREYISGEEIEVKITEAADYDLTAVPI